MAIDTTALVYPFDPTGRQASNKITAEQQVLTARNGRDFQFLVPRYAPYFPESMEITFKGTDNVVKVWTRGQDWFPSHEFIAASLATAKEVFGSVSVFKTDLSGVVSMSYQTTGGDWVQETGKISEILADRLYNPRIAVWDEVANIPYAFPVINHEWNLDDLVGMSEVREEIAAIGEQLRSSGQQGLADHINDQDNPHGVTAAQTGLGNVRNLTTATVAEMIAGVSDDVYATAKGVRAAMDAGPTAAINSHAGNTNNPHGVTAAQTGAYSRTETDAALALKLGRTATAANTDKFGGQTPLEYAASVMQGTAANSMKLGGLTVDELKMEIQGGPAVDTERFNGLTYTEAKDDILSGDAANSIRLGGRTSDEYRAYVLSGTVANAEEVGGYTPTELAAYVLSGTAANSARLGGRTAAEFTSDVLSGTAANATRLANLTVSGLTTQILSGTAANASKAFGLSLSELTTAILGGTADNALRFNGLTPDQYKANVLSGQAADAALFGGMSPAEWQDSLLTGSGSMFAKQNIWNIAKGDAFSQTWLRMGALQFAYNGVDAHPVMSLQWMVTVTATEVSSDSLFAANPATESCDFLVQLTCENPATEAVELRVQALQKNALSSAVSFGYRVADITDPNDSSVGRGAELWVVSTRAQFQVTATDISFGSGFIDTGPAQTNTATPAGLQVGVVDPLGTAVEALKFDNLTPENWYTYIYNEDYSNSVPQRSRAFVLDAAVVKTGWVKIGYIDTAQAPTFDSAQFMVSTAVTQNPSTGQPTASLNLLRFDLARTDYANMVASHRVFGVKDTNIQFAYRTGSLIDKNGQSVNGVEIWMKVTGRETSVSVALLSKGSGDLPDTLDVPVLVAPASLTYLTAQEDAMKADLASYATTASLATTNSNVTTVNNTLTALAIDVNANYALKTYVDTLRTDVESAFNTLKTAIDALTTQINS